MNGMTADLWAQLTLLLYALVAVAVIGWQVTRCQDGWGVWTLHVIQRLFCGLVFHWRANRRCPFPADRPAIIIANHRSPADPMIIWMNHHLCDEGRRPIFRIGFLMAREYYEQSGFIGWICRQMQCIPLERNGKDMQGTRVALKRLKDGKPVGIFPEGRINTGPGLLDVGVGAAWLALKAQVPVYPVFIDGAPQGKTMIEPFCKLCRVRVTYGDPIDLSAYWGKRKTQELRREVTELLVTRLAKLGGVAPPSLWQAEGVSEFQRQLRDETPTSSASR